MTNAQQRVTSALRSAILGGRWIPGDRLPPERSLAGEYGVSRLTLRGSIATLASEGLVRPRQGSGIEILDHRRTGSLDLFGWLLTLPDSDPERTATLFEEIVRLRRLVAVDTLVLAARRATEADIQALEGLAAEQAGRLGDPAAYLQADREIQRRIIRLAGSTAVELLFNSFERVLVRHEDLTLVFIGPLERHLEQYALVRALLSHPSPEDFRSMAEAALDHVEAEGLARVRAHCQTKARP